MQKRPRQGPPWLGSPTSLDWRCPRNAGGPSCEATGAGGVGFCGKKRTQKTRTKRPGENHSTSQQHKISPSTLFKKNIPARDPKQCWGDSFGMQGSCVKESAPGHSVLKLDAEGRKKFEMREKKFCALSHEIRVSSPFFTLLGFLA